MSSSLYLKTPPEGSELIEAAQRDAANFFLTPACAEGYSRLGYTPVLTGQDSSRLLGFMRVGRFTRALELPWVPRPPENAHFWNQLISECRRRRIWTLSVRIIGAALGDLSTCGDVLEHIRGIQHRIHLKGKLKPGSENHRRALKKALQSGLTYRESTAAETTAIHCQLMEHSMSRRRERGESAPIAGASDRYYQAMLGANAGAFFQTLLNGEVVSSLFCLLSAEGAYYQSAGTSPAGMDCGASVFNIVSTAELLASRGIHIFDLGGVEQGNDGLNRFKAGFGSEVTNFEEITLSLAPIWVRKLRTALALLRGDPALLWQNILSVDRSLAYAIQPDASIKSSETPVNITFRKLSDACLHRYCAPGMEFARQRERLEELGYNDAYGAFLGEQLVHVSWLVTAENDARSPIRDVKLQSGEMEITHCQTASNHRGKGIYPAMIRHLTQQAQKAGIRRLFMVTDPLNTASQRGIIKGGLKPCGTVLRIRCPFLFGERALRLRTYRRLF